MKFRVVHADAEADWALPIEREILGQEGAELVCAGAFDPDDIVAAAHDADALLADNAEVPRQVIEGLKRCKVIAVYGIGYNHVDVQAATEHGILVTNTPAFCTEEVSNHTIMLLLACAKRLIRLDQGMRRGHWPDNRYLETTLSPVGSVYGQRLGLIGFGSIGRQVARKAKVLGLHVSAHTRHLDSPVFAEYGVEPLPLLALLEQSDYISIHTPLTDETRGMIGVEELRRMKPAAFLINTGRGAVVDQEALVQALREAWIAGAGLDVFSPEPLPSDSPFLTMDNVVLTPHVASYSDAAFARMRGRVAEEVSMALSGQWPTAVVNPQVRGHSRLEGVALG